MIWEKVNRPWKLIRNPSRYLKKRKGGSNWYNMVAINPSSKKWKLTASLNNNCKSSRWSLRWVMISLQSQKIIMVRCLRALDRSSTAMSATARRCNKRPATSISSQMPVQHILIRSRRSVIHPRLSPNGPAWPRPAPQHNRQLSEVGLLPRVWKRRRLLGCTCRK